MKYLEDEKLLKLTSELTDVVLGRSRSIHGRIEAYTMKRAGTEKKYAHGLGERYVADLETIESQLADYKSFMERHSRFEQQVTTKGGRQGRKRSMSTGSQLEASKPSKQQRPRSNSYDESVNSSTVKSSALHRSPLGDFGEIGTRRLMTDLILTLNASFPDYDFGSMKPSDFEKINVSTAVKRVNERLAEVSVSKVSFLSDLWNAMDDAVHLSECEVYSYAPKTRDQDDDPLSFLTQTLIDSVEDEPSDMENTSLSVNSTTVLWSFNYFFVNKSRKRLVFFTCVECMRSEDSNLEEDDVSYVRFHGTEASDLDFDMDPSAGVAGGTPVDVPISII